MSKKADDAALQGVLRYYEGLTIPQLAFYHGIPKRYAKALRAGAITVAQLGAGKVWRDRWQLGALGSGKTVGGLYSAIAYSALIPGNEGVIVRKRWEEIANHLIPELYRMAGLLTSPDGDYRNGNPARLLSDPRTVGASKEILVKTEGEPSRIVLKPEPDGPERFIEDSFKGPEYGWFLLDEVTQLREVTWRTLTGRLRRPGIPPHLRAGLAMGNPPAEGHWVFDYARQQEQLEEAEGRPEILIIRSTMDDNPHLPEDYVRREKRKYKDDEIRYRMYILGEDGLDLKGRPVFGNMFHSGGQAPHVEKALKYNPFRPLLVGMDFGWHHPAAVFFQIDDKGCVNILSEHLGKEVSAERFAQDVWDQVQKNFPRVPRHHVRFFGDPAGAQRSDKGDTTFAILAKQGIRVGHRVMPIETGLDLIRDLLREIRGSRPRLQAHPRCKDLIKAFLGGYYYDTMRGGGVRMEPKKDGYYDHLVDALRYGLTNTLGVYREPRGGTVAGPAKLRNRGPQFARGMTAAGLSNPKGTK